MDDEEEKQQLRFACLELATHQTKKDDAGTVVDLSASELVQMAEEFYKFINKKELN